MIQDSIFDLLDHWKPFPNYQLERRTDIFFAVHLEQILLAIKGVSINFIIPEFPIRIGTIYKEIDINKSYKIDYVVKIKGQQKVLFIELKTDSGSRRDTQDGYLREANKVGFKALLEGLARIYQVTTYKEKYRSMLSDLAQAGMIYFSDEKMSVPDINYDSEIIYIQPQSNGDNSIIGFDQIADILETSNDPFTLRFCKSLRKWAEKSIIIEK